MTTLLDLLAEWLRGAAAVSIAASLAWISYRVALRLCAGASTAVRLSATAVVTGWLMIAMFWATSLLLAFQLPVVLPLLALLAALTHVGLGRSRTAARQLREDATAALVFLRETTRNLEGWLFLTLGGVVAVRILRSTVSPPLAWDDLTYHLVKAARFVQDGGVIGVSAPGAWSYYEYFPPIGDIVWAWAMLPVRTDALVPIMSGLIWAAALLGTYACGREYGAGRREALLAASAVCSMPAALTYVGSGYVDNTVLASFAMAALFVIRAGRGAPGVETLLATAALAFMLGSKVTTLPIVGSGLLALGWVIWRRPPTKRGHVLLGWVITGTVALPPYVRAWLEFGSPFYPVPLKLAGRTLLQGNPLVAQFSVDSLPPALRLHSSVDFWAFSLLRPGPWQEFNALGPAAILLLLLMLMALPTAVRQRRCVPATLFLMTSAAAVLGLLASDGMRFARETINVMTTGRYLTPAFAAAAIVGASAPGGLVRMLCVPAIVAGVALSLPRSWAGVEMLPMGSGIGILLAIVAVTVLGMIRASRTARTGGLLASIGLALSLAAVALAAARETSRYEIFAAAAARPPVFHVHPLNPVFAAAWPVWEFLDVRPGHRIAVTAGWEVIGHHWYQYPLFGTHLQNRVLYVPITTEGDILDPGDVAAIGRRASPVAWLRRLVDLNVDHVVSLAPRTTIEDFWMRQLPQVFHLAHADARGLHVAYRVDRLAAQAALLSLAKPIPEKR